MSDLQAIKDKHAEGQKRKKKGGGVKSMAFSLSFVDLLCVSRLSHSSVLASPLGLSPALGLNLLDMVAAVTTALRLRVRLGTFCSGWKRTTYTFGM